MGLSYLSGSGLVWHTRPMHTRSATNLYKRHRFPAEIISHCVWLYLRFCLSYRGVEELMAERGIILTYEAVRYWCRKFGKPMPINCAAGGLALVISGIWMKSSSPFMANGTTSGGPLIKTGTYRISWSNATATRRLRRRSSVSCSKGVSMSPA